MKVKPKNCLQRKDRSVEDIKSKYPYNLKAIVESEKKTEQMRHEREHVLEQYNELIEIYKQTIDEMLR